MGLNDLIGDWGGFEKLVATLHETGDVTVEHNVTLSGRSGAPRQIDVLIRHRQGLYEHVVVVECKYWRQSVKRLHVDALATTVREVGAAKGVMFSAKGFQAGAVTEARHQDIDLFVVRDLRKHEWGLPGRIGDMFLHLVQVSMGNIRTERGVFLPRWPGAVLQKPPLDLRCRDGVAESATPLLKPDGSRFDLTLEDAILEALGKNTERALAETGLFNGGEAGIYYLGCPFVLRPSEPFVIPTETGTLTIPELKVDAGLRFDQSRVTVDRGEQLEFSLAVESKVTGKVSTASRAIGANATILDDAAEPRDERAEPALTNGMVARVMLKSFFDFSEMSGLTSVPIEQVRQPLIYTDPNGDEPAT